MVRVLSRLAASTAVALACAAASAQQSLPASPNTPVLPSATTAAPPASPTTPQLSSPAPLPAPRDTALPAAPAPVAGTPYETLAPLGGGVRSSAPVAGTPAPPTARTGRGGTSILPAPVDRPLSIDVAGDPVLSIARQSGDSTAFQRAIAAAVDRNPGRDEATAQVSEVTAQRREARAGLFPTGDLNLTSYKVIDRDFRNDLDNIVERSRPRERTDATLSVNQTLFDFGATSSRISGANARLRAAAAGVDDAASRIAIQTIGAWYDVFAYRVLVTLAQSYRGAQEDRRRDLQLRIAQGSNASADITRLDSSVAAIDQRVARFGRELANAEARYTQLTGTPPPAGLARAPVLGDIPASTEAARDAAANVPAVIASDAQAEGSRRDARAAHADTLPNISAGIVAGRYGVVENERDYDVRGVVTLRHRFFGGGDARADQADARADGAQARAARVREESARDAAVAYADLVAQDRQVEALRTSYIASRISRDTTEERFRVSRGTLFDVIDSNDAYFVAASNFVEALAERDAAHYILLARTGRLLTALGIDSASKQGRTR